MQTLTDLADQAVMLPLILAVGLTLLATGRGRAARAWTLAVPGTLAAVLVLKLAFLACAPAWPGLALRSPSGHAAAAAVVCGSIAWLLGARWAWLVALAAGAVIGASRIALDVHSPTEVALGAAVGLLGVLAFTGLAGSQPPRASRWPLVAAMALVLAGFHGRHLGAEAGIVELALIRIRPMVAGYCVPG